MEDQRVGAAFRAVRIRRRSRQEDVAKAARVSRALVSLIERGHVDQLSLAALRRVGTALDVRVEVVPRWRAGELDRLLNARHSALHETLARFFRDLPGWVAAPEVSFAVYGERGVIDILAWHSARRALLVIELKTDVIDVQDLVGTLDRKRRLAPRVGEERGWLPSAVSTWLVIVDTKTNRRRVEAHAAVLRSAFPCDGREMRGWLRRPTGSVAGLSFWTIASPGSTRRKMPTQQRVRKVTTGTS